MNTTILARCIEELKQETPDISYIRGALETLLEMSATPPVQTYQLNQKPHVERTDTVADEHDDPVLRAYLGGGTATLQPED